MMSTPAADPLRTLTPALSEIAPQRLVESAALLDQCRLAVRRALASSHLVTVAAELADSFGPDPSALEAIGVPVDLLPYFPRWREGLRVPFRPEPSGLQLAPSGARIPIEGLRLQMSPTPGTIPYALLLLRDLLAELDVATRFVVVVEPGANTDELMRVITGFHATAASRVRFAPLRCISVFAQDNARAARDSDGRPVLLVPRAFRAARARAEDELDPIETQKAFGIEVRRSKLYWEGGNIVHDDSRCFVGVDTVAENAARLGLTREEIVALLESEFGAPVTLLGRDHASRFDPIGDRLSSSGQASFHIDLDVSLLGHLRRAARPRALVADAARGLDFVDDVLRLRRLVAGHFLPVRELRRRLRAEYEASAEARHPLLLEYASTLASHGYRVIGMPDLRIDPQMDVFQRVNLDFGFCNVLPGLQRKRPSIAHFVSGVPRLDRDAAQRMRLAGAHSVPVSSPEVASALRLLHGGLRCCCGAA